jgi:trimeric autotransporter adhesin
MSNHAKSVCLFTCFLVATFLITETQAMSPSSGLTATNFVVTNTQDSGFGSLRQAIADANNNPGPNSISFDIPPGDANFVGYQDDGIVGTYDPNLPIVPVGSGHDQDGPLWWRIMVDSGLPAITRDGTSIDGSSQRFNRGDRNPFGPEVEIVRNPAIWVTFGLVLACNESLVQEIIVNNFGVENVSFNGSANRLQGSYVGIEPGGANSTAHMNSSDNNISISGNNNTIGGLAAAEANLVSGNGLIGVFIDGSNNQIVANYIGVNRQVTEVVGGALEAIQIWGGSKNLIAHNVIGGGAITLEFPGAFQTTIRDNYIGTDPSGILNLAGTTYFGAVYVVGTSSNNTIGPDNVIKNHQRGVVIHGSTATNNTITQNAISNNGSEGISLVNGGNSNIQSPVITFVGAGYVAGTAPPQTTIEIFSDSDNQGMIHEGVTQADSQGDFTWYGIPEGPNVTATATDSNGNTSEFSAPYPVYSNWLPLILN